MIATGIQRERIRSAYHSPAPRHARARAATSPGLGTRRLSQVFWQVFWQVHRGTIVNANAIADVHRHGGQFVVQLKQRPERLAVSESYLKQFRQM